MRSHSFSDLLQKDREARIENASFFPSFLHTKRTLKRIKNLKTHTHAGHHLATTTTTTGGGDDDDDDRKIV